MLTRTKRTGSLPCSYSLPLVLPHLASLMYDCCRMFLAGYIATRLVTANA